MNCETCGTINAPGATTCAGCGRPLTGTPSGLEPPGAPDAGATPPPPPPPAPGTPGGSGEAWPPPPTPGAPYPPSGPPPGYGPPGAGAYPGPPAKGRNNLLLGLAVVVVLALVAAAAFVVLNQGDDDAVEVVLEPIDMVQEDDFTGNLDVGEAAGAAFSDLDTADLPDARVEQVETPLAGQVVEGAEPAVYGGSRDTQVCDVAALTDFLTDEANADKAAAWAEVLGIEVGDIESYIGGLTAVRLRWDTRVTNHGFRDGEANPFQALLQAGTAVLVDDTGVPRVKCNCGNPLGEPAALGDTSTSSALDVEDVAQNPDDAWDGLDPAEAVAIQPGESAVSEITLVDVDTGGLIERPVGSDGASKTDTGTGDVQVTLDWSSDSDLDLSVAEPDGTVIYYYEPGPTSTGGELDVDSNVNCDNDGGVENIFWPPGDAPSGTYTVTVTGFRLSRDDGSSCGGGDYTLTITVEGEETVETGSVGQDGEMTYEFEVP